MTTSKVNCYLIFSPPREPPIKGSLYGKRRSPARQIGPGLVVYLSMQIGDPRHRRSRATKVHAENLLEQARRSAWQRAQPGPLLGHGCIVCRYPPPSLKLHLHCLTPENGNKADRRSGQPLEHKISRSHATAEYTLNGARVQSELPCLAARSRPAPRPLSREPNNPYLTEREVRVPKSADLPGCKVYSP